MLAVPADPKYQAIKDFCDTLREQVHGASIDVGVLVSLSGTMAHNGASVAKAILFAIQEINAGPLFSKHPLFPEVANGDSNAEHFRRLATDLCDRRFEVIFGCWTSAARKAVKQVLESPSRRGKRECLLIYPVQFEGLETSPHIVYTGATPNQQIYPALEWYAQGKGRGKKNFKCSVIGSDYIYPRAAAVLVNNWLMTRQHESFAPRFIPFVHSGKADRGVQKHISEAIQGICSDEPDLILNFINGDANAVFFQKIAQARQSRKLNDIPTISFSLTPADLSEIDAEWMNDDFVAVSYLESLAADPDSFASKFKAFNKATFNAEEATTDAMWNAYVGVHLWAKAAGDVISQGRALTVSNVRESLLLTSSFTVGKSTLRLDSTSLHIFKTPLIGQIKNVGGNLSVECVPDLPTDQLSPEPYPLGIGTPQEWDKYMLLLSLASDFLPDDFLSVRDLFLNLAMGAAPKAKANPWSEIASTDKSPGLEGKLKALKKLFMKIHNLDQIQAVQQGRFASRAELQEEAEKLCDFIKELKCTDEDMRLFSSRSDEFRKTCHQFAKAKAICYRLERFYLFDVLDHSFANLKHSVFLDGKPVDSLQDLEVLLHDEARLTTTALSGWQPLILPSLGAHRLTHYVQTCRDDKTGRPTEIRYYVVFAGDPQPQCPDVSALGESVQSALVQGGISRLALTLKLFFKNEHDRHLAHMNRQMERFELESWMGQMNSMAENACVRAYLWNNKTTPSDPDAWVCILAGFKVWRKLRWD